MAEVRLLDLNETPVEAQDQGEAVDLRGLMRSLAMDIEYGRIASDGGDQRINHVFDYLVRLTVEVENLRAENRGLRQRLSADKSLHSIVQEYRERTAFGAGSSGGTPEALVLVELCKRADKIAGQDSKGKKRRTGEGVVF